MSWTISLDGRYEMQRTASRAKANDLRRKLKQRVKVSGFNAIFLGVNQPTGIGLFSHSWHVTSSFHYAGEMRPACLCIASLSSA